MEYEAKETKHGRHASREREKERESNRKANVSHEVVESRKKHRSKDRQIHRESSKSANKKIESLMKKGEVPLPTFDVYEYIDRDDMDIVDNVKLRSRKKKFTCDSEGCNKRYAFQSGLEKHKRLHLTFRCDWDHCEATFPSKRSLDNHHKTHQAFNSCQPVAYEDFELNDSQQSFQSNPKEAIAEPEEHFARGSRPKEDGLHSRLEQSSEWRSGGQSSVDNFKMGDTPVLLCPDPGSDYRTSENYLLNNHYKIHTDPNKCEVCGKVFLSRAQTNKHIQIQHKKPSDLRDKELNHVPCEWYSCQTLFSSRKEMLDHMRDSHEHPNQHRMDAKEFEEAPKVIICAVPDCGQNFSSEPLFKDHLKSHARRLVPCIWPECEFKTNSTELIKEHMESHLKR